MIKKGNDLPWTTYWLNFCVVNKGRHVHIDGFLLMIKIKERMFKFGISLDNKCCRCEEVEKNRHHLWDCVDAKRIWHAFNEYVDRDRLKTSQ